MASKNYYEMYKKIRPYVSFTIKKSSITPSQKRQITRYYNIVTSLTAQPYTVYKTKSKKRFEKVKQVSTNPDKNYPALKVAFLRTSGSNDVKVSFKNDTVIVTDNNVSFQYIPFDKWYIDHPKHFDKHVDNQIKKYAPKSKRYKIRVGKDGEYEIETSYTHKGVKARLSQLMAEYSTYITKTKKANNHYTKWLDGLSAIDFVNQKDFKSYDTTYKSNNKDIKEKRLLKRKRLNKQKSRKKLKRKK